MAHGIFLEHVGSANIDHILGYKTNLNRCKRTEIIQSVFSDHKGIKLEINNRKTTRKSQDALKLNNSFLNSPWITEETSKEIFKIYHFVKMKTMKIQHIKICEMQLKK